MEKFETAVLATEYFNSYVNKLLSHIWPTTSHCIKRYIVKILLHGPDGAGKRLLAKTSAEKLNMKFCEVQVPNLFDENIVGSAKKFRLELTKFLKEEPKPLLIYCSDYEFLTFLDQPDMDCIREVIKESLEELENSPQPVVFIAGTREFNKVSRTALRFIFHRDILIKPASKQEAIEVLKSFQESTSKLFNPIELLDTYPQRQYYLGILMHLCRKAELDLYKLKNFNILPTKINHKKETRWSDVGGLSYVKKEIIDAILSTRNKKFRRIGLLLSGPPGTGKTLIAKAVATECNLTFINVKGPEILDKYIGESEANIRRLFKRARDSDPSVIFLDEIDSLAPARGRAGDSAGVMDRMVSQLLTEMDSLRETESVFVIGATNRKDLVDPSLLRPGRFDRIIEVPLPTTPSQRVEILVALTRKMTLSDDVNFPELESKIPPQQSGADFQGLCQRAMQKTLDRCIEQIEAGKATEEDADITTKMDDFISSIKSK